MKQIKDNKDYFEIYKTFAIVKNEKTNNKYKVAFTNYILNQNYSSIIEAKKAIDDKDYQILIDIIGIVCEMIINNKEIIK